MSVVGACVVSAFSCAVATMALGTAGSGARTAEEAEAHILEAARRFVPHIFPSKEFRRSSSFDGKLTIW